MKIIYDRDTDILTMIFKEGKVAESDELRDGIIIDYDNNGHIISMEVMDASEHTHQPLSVAYEVKETPV
jgi:uncharacterized protein YuzE